MMQTGNPDQRRRWWPRLLRSDRARRRERLVEVIRGAVPDIELRVRVIERDSPARLLIGVLVGREVKEKAVLEAIRFVIDGHPAIAGLDLDCMVIGRESGDGYDMAAKLLFGGMKEKQSAGAIRASFLGSSPASS